MSFKTFILLFTPVLIFTGILYYTMFWNIMIALSDYSILNPIPHFTGLKSFDELFSSYEFMQAFLRTLLWVAVLVTLGNALGLFLASAIFQFENVKVRNVLTAFFLYPMSLSLIVVGIVWRWLFDPYRGVDVIFSSIGLPTIFWLEGNQAFWSLTLISIWVYAGFITMLYLATFYNVDKALIESAMIDGADTLTIMLKVVLPNAKQGLIISTIFLALFAIQMFDLPYSILFLNPFTETIVMYVYSKFVSQYFYLASAAAIVIIAISAFIVIPYSFYGLKRWIIRR
ncbi:MAG: ABC transporter permease subunit [Thermoprotei archaeon]